MRYYSKRQIIVRQKTADRKNGSQREGDANPLATKSTATLNRRVGCAALTAHLDQDHESDRSVDLRVCYKPASGGESCCLRGLYLRLKGTSDPAAGGFHYRPSMRLASVDDSIPLVLKLRKHTSDRVPTCHYSKSGWAACWVCSRLR